MNDKRFEKNRRRIRRKAFVLTFLFHALLLGGLYLSSTDTGRELVQQVKIMIQGEETPSRAVKAGA